jgi:hypothetical protein
MSEDASLADTDSIVPLLGEVLDLLAGIEARQKVLAREIASMRSHLEQIPHDDVLDDLQTSFAENLEKERNSILSRVSLLSNLPADRS